MKVGVIGLGFVGSALVNGFNDEVDVIKIDPKLNTNIADLINFKPELVFISVPTPMNDDGSQDISIVEDIINELSFHNTDFIIILKSTVLPSYVNKISKIYNKFVLNPEFLRENHANEDFINSKTIIFGGDINNIKIVSNFYKKYTKCISKEHFFTDHVSASLIKYAINSFLATKVVFFNELKSVFDKSSTNISWTNFIEAISSDIRIGSSHMDVPGPDKRYGFGGPCFPKDTNALYLYSKEIGSELKLLEKAININNDLRAMYNDVSEREKEQNINFKT